MDYKKEWLKTKKELEDIKSKYNIIDEQTDWFEAWIDGDCYKCPMCKKQLCCINGLFRCIEEDCDMCNLSRSKSSWHTPIKCSMAFCRLHNVKFGTPELTEILDKMEFLNTCIINKSKDLFEVETSEDIDIVKKGQRAKKWDKSNPKINMFRYKEVYKYYENHSAFNIADVINRDICSAQKSIEVSLLDNTESCLVNTAD